MSEILLNEVSLTEEERKENFRYLNFKNELTYAIIAFAEIAEIQENTETNQLELMLSFQRCLQNIINTHSKEKESNTKDFILAEFLNNCLKALTDLRTSKEENPIPDFLCNCLDAFTLAVNKRDNHV
jgi:hypothetical protein